MIQDASETNGSVVGAAATTIPPQTNGISNGHGKLIPDEVATAVDVIDNDDEATEKKIEAKKCIGEFIKKQQSLDKVGKVTETKKQRDTSNDHSVKVIIFKYNRCLLL